MSATHTAPRKVVVAGLANTGKTSTSNLLTGSYGLVANYHMTTLEPQENSYTFQGETYRIVDTPGCSGIYAKSDEELILRTLLADQRPDVILQCVDAARLRQSLLMTSQLMLFGIPLVIALNSVSETSREGGRLVDRDVLARMTGLPVVEVFTHDRGRSRVYDLKEALKEAAADSSVPQQDRTRWFRLDGPIGAAAEALARHLPQTVPPHMRSAAALILLMRDPSAERSDILPIPAAVIEERNRLLETIDGDFLTTLNRQQTRWIDVITAAALKPGRLDPKRHRLSERFSYYSRHPFWGLFFLGAFLVVAYFLVVDVAGWIGGSLEHLISDPVVGFITGSALHELWKEFLVGEYGVLTLGLFNAIVTVLPILSIFFFLFGLLEDVGYLPNLSVLLRRSFSRLGLSGKAIMPIVLGFGCKTMATMTTRSLTSRKERVIAIYLIAFAIPCSAQLGLNMAILGNAGFGAFLIALGFLVLVEVVAGTVLNRILPSEGTQSFIQELPPFRIPSLREVIKKTRYRLWWFLKESVLIFIIAAVVIFTFDKIGLLGGLKRLLDPLVVFWMGLPIEMVDALILMIAREEAAAGLILRLSQEGRLDFIQSVVAVVTTTMFIPCFANIVAMFKEVGTRAALLMLIAINSTTILLAGGLNWLMIGVSSLL